MIATEVTADAGFQRARRWKPDHLFELLHEYNLLVNIECDVKQIRETLTQTEPADRAALLAIYARGQGAR